MAAESVICDTDVMIDYLDGSKSRHQSVKTIVEKSIGIEQLMISAITKMELIRGVSNKIELDKLNQNINIFNILVINAAITTIAIKLIEKYRLSHNLEIPDALIAATAIYTGQKLFTFNVKDFKFISDLHLYQH